MGKCLQLVLKLIPHAYSNDIMIAFKSTAQWASLGVDLEKTVQIVGYSAPVLDQGG